MKQYFKERKHSILSSSDLESFKSSQVGKELLKYENSIGTRMKHSFNQRLKSLSV